MKYLALATDYDGTLAHDGFVSEATVAALERVRASGRRLLLVTGRRLERLLELFPHGSLFDRIIAENGAILFDPATATRQVLSPPPPEEFIVELQRRRVPIIMGQSVVATMVPHEHQLLDVIRDLGLEWHVIFNKGAVMALPSGVTKATGLVAALQELGVERRQTIGIGDAENDHAFLHTCGLRVAVANALPALKDEADLVTRGDRGEGVVELIERIVANDLSDLALKREGITSAAEA
jgi:hydroxymethylpyrimidine pyrophosphatase-like HAD family hydrolase